MEKNTLHTFIKHYSFLFCGSVTVSECASLKDTMCSHFSKKRHWALLNTTLGKTILIVKSGFFSGFLLLLLGNTGLHTTGARFPVKIIMLFKTESYIWQEVLLV